jgi:hypothetical protein
MAVDVGQRLPNLLAKNASGTERKTVTEIVTDTLTLVPKLTLLTLSSHVESTTYVLSIAGSCIRLTGLSAISCSHRLVFPSARSFLPECVASRPDFVRARADSGAGVGIPPGAFVQIAENAGLPGEECAWIGKYGT